MGADPFEWAVPAVMQPGRKSMKNGLRVYDSDTHINPAAEILNKYVNPDFRPRLPELARYRSPSGQAADGKSDLHNYRTGTKYYRRILSEEAPRETFTGRDALDDERTLLLQHRTSRGRGHA
jgi:hypothetical protein